MDHKSFVAGLDASVKARLTGRTNRAGLQHLVSHLGAVVLIAALISLGVPGWWALLPLQGVLIVFLFTLEHETTHKTPFASERLNEAVGYLCGFLLFLPFLWFRYFHLAHHKWTNIAGKDPELQTEKPDGVMPWIWHVSGIPYLISEVSLVVRLTRGRVVDSYLPDSALSRISTEARWMLLGYAAVFVSLFFDSFLFWVWLLPLLLGQPALRLYLLAEHGDCPRVANMFENTRTTYTSAMMRLLAWNMPFHVEHHVYPAVPFHQLPSLHDLMKDELRVTADGYRQFTVGYLARRKHP